MIENKSSKNFILLMILIKEQIESYIKIARTLNNKHCSKNFKINSKFISMIVHFENIKVPASFNLFAIFLEVIF